MLNRRHLRIKVLQNLYAFFQTQSTDVHLYEKKLLEQVNHIERDFTALTDLLLDICKYAEDDARERSEKFIPSEEDKNASIRLAENPIILAFEKNPAFLQLAKKYKVTWRNQSDMVRKLFRKLRDQQEYIDYCESEPETAKDKQILLYIVKKVLLKSEEVELYFEENNLNWPNDKDMVSGLVEKFIKDFDPEKPAQSPPQLSANWEDDRDFYLKLFRLTVSNNDEFEKLIDAKATNWELERIALMDMLLMKMALAELQNFTSIPVKVSINEYIEISKNYSTPNSKSFINGLLDKLVAELKADGSIKKTGRGLME